MVQTPAQLAFETNLVRGHGHLTPGNAFPEEETAQFLVHSPFIMTLDDRRTVFFCPGVVDVPESIANHWALAIHGRRVDPAPEAAAESIEPNSDDTEDDEAIAAADEAERKAHDAAAGDAEREAHTAKLAAIARKAANRSGKGR